MFLWLKLARRIFFSIVFVRLCVFGNLLVRGWNRWRCNRKSVERGWCRRRNYLSISVISY